MKEGIDMGVSVKSIPEIIASKQKIYEELMKSGDVGADKEAESIMDEIRRLQYILKLKGEANNLIQAAALQNGQVASSELHKKLEELLALQDAPSDAIDSKIKEVETEMQGVRAALETI